MASPLVLGLFAKRPLPGQVKTRLAAQTSPEWAAHVADAFLRDVLARLATLEARIVLAYAPDTEEAFFRPLVQDRFDLTPQGEGDLGQRMRRFFARQLRSGSERIVVLGTDSPNLPLEYVTQAFRELERADVVLGPASDGGYYLVGCARRLPDLFDGIAWSGPRVLADTVARLSAAERLALLPPWYDVDTLDDWRMLRGHLAALRRAGVDPGLECTEAIRDPDSSFRAKR